MMDDIGLQDIATLMGSFIHEPTADEYVGADGLLMCSKCHTPREREFVNPLDPSLKYKPRVMCRCQREQDDAETAAENQRKERMAIDKLRRASLMGERFKASTFDRWDITDRSAYNLCRRYADNFDAMYADNQGLLFYGPPGTGKTFAAACIANQLLARGVSVIMTSFVKLMATVESKDDENELIAAMNHAKLLIIDDLGAERTTSYAAEKVYNFVDSRYSSKRPMILTTNHTWAQIQGDADIAYRRIYDRVSENCFPLLFTGPSRRQDEAARRYDRMQKMMGD